jgi:hypothetical protein
MAAKLTRLTHKIAIQLHLVAESFTVCSSRARWPVRKLLGTPSYESIVIHVIDVICGGGGGGGSGEVKGKVVRVLKLNTTP